MKDTLKYITVKGAKENNLKDVNVVLPKNKFIVFTGISGSGKSSLAFKVIYEEGRRRYVDSLSSYARQFLGGTSKPLVESIDGLSPAIAIEQKTTHNNPRSTVGTVTEIYDYLRLLYSRIGKPHCPKHKHLIEAQTSKEVVRRIFKYENDSKLIISSPIVKNKTGTHKDLLEKLLREGFLRVKVNGQIFSLEDEIILEKNKKNNIEIIIDRLILNHDNKSRIAEAIELAFEYSKGLATIEINGKQIETFSKFHSCEHGDFDMPLIEPKLFSFNSPSGMCLECKGLGLKLKVDHKKLIPDKTKSIMQGAILYFKNLLHSSNLEWQQFKELCNYYKIDLYKPINELTKKEFDILLIGSEGPIEYSLESSSGNKYEKFEIIEGIATKIERKHLSTTAEQMRTYYRKNFMSDIKCSSCHGTRLNKFARAVKIDGINIHELTKLSIDECLDKIISLELNDSESKISELVVNELTNRLGFLSNVGLDYLSLNRKAETLSGGEAQRIRLATQIGSNLTGVLYVLDEPSIGLHQKDNNKLLETLKKMVELGNTLLVVEHDEETIRAAEHIVEIGPRAGKNGGKIIAQGTPSELMKNQNSLTGDFLSGRRKIEIPKSRRSGNGKVIQVSGATENNLKKINVKFPLGKLIAVTGVSGSGKSTLVNEVLAKAIQKNLTNEFIIPGKHKEVKGLENIDKLVRISQSPIGRTPRSNPATYTSVFDDIRDLFVKTKLARARGYLKGRFSFNVDGGRCDKCKGDGLRKIQMHFLPDVYIECDQCDGKRYNDETLEVKYKNKNIADVLDMRVEEALVFFESVPKILVKLKTIFDVGLGYIKLGQSATTLSGGEAQRVKLATFLQKKATGKTLYILDEPTTGLHPYDIKKLISVLNRIVDGGDTVVVIEHNLDAIKVVDYIIDLGPGGGKNGGSVIATGTPEQVSLNDESFTGKYLKGVLYGKSNK